MHFTLSVIGNQGQYADFVLPCYYALTALGWQCDIRANAFSQNTVNIIFGAHALPPDVQLPKGSIVHNSEQMALPAVNGAYVNLLKQAGAVWDFSQNNVLVLRERFGIDATYVFPGYVPEMTCLKQRVEENIDLLFYESKTGRRDAALASIMGKGVEPTWIYAFGHRRDAAIARAAMVLNVHADTPASLEVARLGFLWANKKAVISETCPEHGIPEGLEDACFYAAYENLPDAVMMLHTKPALRRAVAQKGFDAFRAKPLQKILEKVVGRKASVFSSRAVPAMLNVGSGSDFKPYCINVDISPTKKADIQLDLSHPMDWSRKYATVRFGEVSLVPGSFHRIIVHHVLEHVPNLTRMMQNFLLLLETGGEVEIGVPYDLSFGAWQDPTHLRAFNEKSWQYFCELHDYLGWRDFCFELVDLDYELSRLGKTLIGSGMPWEEVLRTPRAVDAMNVVLRKREASSGEKTGYDIGYQETYTEDFPTWRI